MQMDEECVQDAFYASTNAQELGFNLYSLAGPSTQWVHAFSHDVLEQNCELFPAVGMEVETCKCATHAAVQ